MPRSVIYVPTASNFTWGDNYAEFAPTELDDVANQDKVLMNIGGNLTWIDFPTFVDNIASHLTLLKPTSISSAPAGSFLRISAGGDLVWSGLVDTSALLVGSPSQVLLFTDSEFYTLSGSNFTAGLNLATGSSNYAPQTADMTIDNTRKGLTVPNGRYITDTTVASPNGSGDFTVMYIVRYTGSVADHSCISNREPDLDTPHVNFLIIYNFGSYHRLAIDTGSANTSTNLSGTLTTNTLYCYFTTFNSSTKKFSIYFSENGAEITTSKTLLQDDTHINAPTLNTDPLRIVNGWESLATEPTNTILHAFGVYNTALTMAQMNDIIDFMVANTANS